MLPFLSQRASFPINTNGKAPVTTTFEKNNSIVDIGSNTVEMMMNCPQLEAIMIDGCGPVEGPGEFFMFTSGCGGFTANDIEFDFDPNNNIGGAVGNDINLGASPCTLGSSNPADAIGCNPLTQVFFPSPNEVIPAGVIVVVYTSAGSAPFYNFSSICGQGVPVYVYRSNCNRGAFGAFSNGASNGLRTYTLSVTGSGCGSVSMSYDASTVPNSDGAYQINGGSPTSNPGCLAPPVSLPSPPPAPTLSDNNPCEGQSLILTATPSNYDEYVWRLPNMSTITTNINTLTIPNASPSDSGPYSVTGVQGCTSSGPSNTVTVVILPGSSNAPSISVQPNNPACVGDILILLVNNPAVGATYHWTGPNGFSQSTNSIALTVSNSATAAMAGTYEVYAEDGACSSPIGDVDVDIVSPDPPDMRSPTLCESDSDYDLNGLLIGNTVAGVWSVNNSPIVGNTIDPSNYSGQTIDIEITPLLTSCAASGTTTITVDAATSPTLEQSPDDICEDSGLFDLSSLLDDPSVIGDWTANGSSLPSSSLNPSNYNGTVNIEFIPNGSCALPATTNITISTAPAIDNIVPTNPSCDGGDGTISVTASGSSPLEYSLDGTNFDSDNTFDNLDEDTYTIYIRDANNCVTTQAQTLTAPTAPTINNIVPTNPSCDGGDGTISVTASGSSPLEYSLDGTNFDNDNTFDNLDEDTYTIHVRDANNCVSTQTQILTAPTAPVVDNITPTNASCGQNTGSISISASGGTGDLEYSINGTDYFSTPDFDMLGSANYTIYVRDENLCVTTDVQNILNDAGPSISGIQTEGAICSQANGQITITASGGIGNLMYSIDGTNYQSSNFFDDLLPNIYTLHVRDENNCVFGPISTNLVDNPGPTIQNAVPTNATCSSIDGTITITASGGTGDIEYSIDGTNFQVSNIFNSLSANTYTITIRDQNNCIETTSPIVINSSQPPAVNQVDPTDTNCGADDGSITINATGGTGSIEYSIDGTNFQISNTFNSLAANTYTITIRDQNNCTATSNPVIINSSDAPTFQQVNPIDANCDADDGSITINATGGTGNIEYSIDGTNFQISNTFNSLAANTYTITIRDQNNCTATSNPVTINSSDAPSFQMVDPTDANCGADDGSIIISATGGTGNIEYSIDGTNFQISNTFNSLVANTYTITIRDQNNCTATSNPVTINSSGVPTILQVIPADANCGVNDGTITITASTGTNSIEYSIDGVNYQTDNIFDNLEAGSYVITVRDENLCTTSVDPITINSNDAPTIQQVTPTDANCNADDGLISVSASGGVGNLQYSIDGINFQANSTFDNLPAGNYSISVRDENLCTSIADPITINSNDTPTIQQVIPTDANCNADDGSISVFASGGVGSLQYSIDGINFQANSTFDNLPAGNYSITVRDENLCTSTADPVAINSNDAPTIQQVTPTDANCNANDGSISISASGGVGNLQFSIDGTNFQASNTFDNLPAGNYSITVRDENLCTSTADLVAINSNDAPTIQQVTPTDANCNTDDGSISVSASGGVGNLQYSIDGINFQANSTFDNLPAGNYSISVRDENLCTSTADPVAINSNDAPTIQQVTPTDANCNADDGSISVSASSGVGNLQYSIDGINFQANSTFDNLPAGNYSISVRDENLCTSTADPVAINSNDAPTIQQVTPTDANCNADDGSISVFASSGVGSLQYSIDGINFQANSTFDNLPAGNYSISVRDENLCTSIADPITINSNDAPTIQQVIPTDANCNADDGSISVSASGGVGSLQYSIDGINFQANSTFDNLPAGNYSISVRDENLCTALSDPVNIGNTDSPEFDNVETADPQCGMDDGTIEISSTTATQFSIDGLNYQANGLFENLAADNYTLYIRNNQNCINTTTATLASNNAPTLDNTSTVDPTCGASTGVIELIASGGSGNLSYSIDGMNYQSSNRFEQLLAGTYDVFIQDELGCITQSVLTLTDGSNLVIDNVVAITESCGEANGSLSINASGGSGSLEYSIDGVNFQFGNTFQNLPKGEYDITVRDGKGCLSSQRTTLAGSEAVTLSCNAIRPVSNPNSADGLGNVMITGGTAPYTVGWAGAVNGSQVVNSIGDLSIDNLAVGNYAVGVEDANGCVAVCTFIIDQSICSNIEFTIDTSLCFGESLMIENRIFNENNPTGIVTVDGVVPGGCDSIINVQVNFLPPLNGSISGSTIICNGDETELVFNLEGDNLFDVVISDGVNPPFTLENIEDGHILPVQPEQSTNYTLLEVTGVNAQCESIISTNVVTIDVTELAAEINLIGTSNCFDASENVAQVIPQQGTAPYTFNWSSGSDRDTSVLPNAGWHLVTIIDANGCEVVDSIEVLENLPPQFLAEAIPPTCEEISRGAIIIQDIEGAGDYEYSLDGNDFFAITATPFIIPGVTSGLYEMTVRDRDGCFSSETIEMPEADMLFLEFGESRRIKKGESVSLSFETDAVPAEIIWSPVEGLSCTDCASPIASPTVSTSYTVRIIDVLGCEISAQVNVFVEKQRRVYIPSAFSPNGDSNNDLFIIEVGEEVEIINILQVFDRWGNMVFEAKDFQAGDPSFGWNGRFNNEDLQQGVYVYRMELTYEDGEEEAFAGDVTLLR